MSYPASMLTVQLTADFRRLIGGDALEAQVWISSPSALVSPLDDVIVPRANEIVETLNGLLSVELPVADDTEWGPQGFQYLIRATFATGVQMAWLVQLLTGQGAEQDLADYGVEIPYPDSSAPFTVLYPSAPVGGGGGAGVDSFAGRSGIVLPATNDYSVAQINGLATALSGKASTAHAATHASAGSDPLTLTQAQITGLVAALVAKADLVGGVLPTSQLPALAVTSYLGASANQAAMLAKVGQEGDWTIRTDVGTVWWITGADPTIIGGWTQAAYPTAPVISVNTQTGAVTLAAADVGAPPTARTISAGVGLTGGGDLSANRTLNVSLGTSSNQAAAGNDARFGDARTPLAHAASHAAAGSDPVTLTQAQVTGLPAALTGKVDLSTLTTKGDLYVATGVGALVRVGVGANGQVLTADSAAASGVKWAPGGGGSALVVRQGLNTAGNVSTGTAGAWALVGAGTLTFSIAAVANDVVSLDLSFMRDFGSVYVDVAVVVAGAAVRYWSTNGAAPATEGAPWYYIQPATYRTHNGPWMLKVASGDLAGGNITFQFAAKGTTGQIFASTAYPLYWSLKNYGPVDFA